LATSFASSAVVKAESVRTRLLEFGQRIESHRDAYESLPFDYDLTVPAEEQRLTALVVQHLGADAITPRFLASVVTPIEKGPDAIHGPTSRFVHAEIPVTAYDIWDDPYVRIPEVRRAFEEHQRWPSMPYSPGSLEVLGRVYLDSELEPGKEYEIVRWIKQRLEDRDHVSLPDPWLSTRDSRPPWMLEPVGTLRTNTPMEGEESSAAIARESVAWLLDHSAVTRRYLQQVMSAT
jgi:hypothetical protein